MARSSFYANSTDYEKINSPELLENVTEQAEAAAASAQEAANLAASAANSASDAATAIAGAVRFDGAQPLNETQQAQARDNIAFDNAVDEALTDASVRFDKSLDLTDEQKRQALANIGADYVFDVRNFGAKLDGETDDAPAIKRASDAAAAAGGGIVSYPPGVCLVGRNETNTDSGTQHLCIRLVDNVRHIGSEPNATIVKAKDGSDAHVFYGFNLADSGVENLTIDGNRANQTEQNPSTGNDPSGIVCIGASTRVRHRNLLIKNTCDYGIGFQGAAVADDCLLEDIIIENSGADGIDTKDIVSGGARQSRMRNITVRDMTPTVGQGERQAGVNPGYGWALEDIAIFGLSGDQVGVRMQGDPTGERDGKRSSLRGFRIQADSVDTTHALQVQAPNVIVDGGHIEGTNYGVLAYGEGAAISNVQVFDTTADAFLALEQDTTPNNIKFINCHAKGSGTRGFTVREDVTNALLSLCTVDGYSRGFDVNSGADGTAIVGCRGFNNSIAEFVDAGTNTTRLSFNAGLNTFAASENIFPGRPRPSADNTIDNGRSDRRWANGFFRQVRLGAGAQITTSGAGTPEGAITAPVGSLYTRTDGTAGSVLYLKETGSGNTGWTALGTAAAQTIGSSGGNVPLLNAANSWSALQTFTTAASLTSVVDAVCTHGDANAGPVVRLWRQSPSPAANDALAEQRFLGANSGSAATTYADTGAVIVSPTAAAETGEYRIRTRASGTLVDGFGVSNGARVGTAAYMGAGTLNLATALYNAGTKVVGAQGAAVSDATGGTTVDTQARAAINDLLARLREHGLIAA